MTLIIIVFIGGSGIVQIQETENVNRNNQPEGGKGVGREGERILSSLPLAIFHFLSSSLYFGPFSIIWTPGTGKITASMILLVIFKTVARGLARKLNPRQTDRPVLLHLSSPAAVDIYYTVFTNTLSNAP